jgi:DNA-binding Xre family transcriptional regulator
MTAVRRCADCGSALSRYNNGFRCQSCSAAEAPTTVTLSPELIEDPGFIRALYSGDWQTALQEINRATGMSQVVLSAATGVSQSHISRLMSGKSTEPGLATIRALCDGLGIPRRLAGLAELRDPEDETNRRKALGMGAGAAGLALLGAFAGSSATTGDDLLLAEMTVTLRRLEQNTPTRALISSATAHAELICGMRKRNADGAYARRLSGVESEAYGFAAWLFADLGEQASARRYYRKAIKAAQASRNPLLTCYMRGSFGQFATSTGAAAQGRDLLGEARYHLPKSAPPIARLWLDALEGTAIAYVGDRSALPLLESAERQLKRGANSEPVWPWLFHFDERKLASYRALAAGRLGYTKLAERYFDLADQIKTSPKQRAMSTVARATALAASNATGSLESACSLANHALDTGRQLGSERVISAVREFRSGLGVKSDITAALDGNLSASYEEDL